MPNINNLLLFSFSGPEKSSKGANINICQRLLASEAKLEKLTAYSSLVVGCSKVKLSLLTAFACCTMANAGKSLSSAPMCFKLTFLSTNLTFSFKFELAITFSCSSIIKLIAPGLTTRADKNCDKLSKVISTATTPTNTLSL